MAESSEAAQILTNAFAPRSATVDGVNVQSNPIPDQIAADQYAAAKRASRRGLFMRHVKLVPPSPSGVNTRDIR